MIPALVIGPAERARAAEIVSFAKAHPIKDGRYPEDGTPYSMELEVRWKVAFTYSIEFTGVTPFRHLTIVHRTGLFPPPSECTEAIAALFRFEGPPSHWFFVPHTQIRALVVLQRIETPLEIAEPCNSPGGDA